MFENIIGQKRVKTTLVLEYAACRKAGLPLTHMVLSSGMGGTGKSTLVEELANEFGAKLVIVAANDAKPMDIARGIANAGHMGIVFLEEYNSPNRDVDDFLRTYLEGGRVLVSGNEFVCDYNAEKKYTTTIIIATNNISALSQPLVSRLLVVHMEESSEGDLIEIAKLHAGKLGVAVANEQVFESIAKASRGIPRTIRRILETCQKMQLVGNNPIDVDDVKQVFYMRGIFPNGVDLLDVKLLKALAKSEMGIAQLSGATGESQDTIRQREPYLIALGLMDIRNKRIITPEGLRFLNSI